MDKETINIAFENLATTKADLYSASEDVIERKAVLDILVSQALLDERIKGGNAETRKAAALNLFTEEFNALANAEGNERNATFNYQLAQIEVDRVKHLLRLEELLAA